MARPTVDTTARTIIRSVRLTPAELTILEAAFGSASRALRVLVDAHLHDKPTPNPPPVKPAGKPTRTPAPKSCPHTRRRRLALDGPRKPPVLVCTDCGSHLT